MEKFFKWLESDRFEKLTWWIIGLSFSYFLIRFVIGIVWDI